MTVPQGTKRDRIVAGLRREILAGELPRGARLPQDELARRFHASSTPVREALRLLEAEGLLVSEPHRGVRVAGVDLDRIKAVYVTRRLVEGHAMQRVVDRLSPRDLARARLLVQRMDDAGAIGDVERYRAVNREFHFFFYRRCGLPALAEQIESGWNAFPWDLTLSSPQRLRASHLEHVAILAAVEAGDRGAVVRATGVHLAQGFAAVARRLSDGGDAVPDPFDDLDAD